MRAPDNIPTEGDVRAVLNTIIDPCSIAARAPIGLDDMGLVGHVAIAAHADGAHIDLSVGVTHPFCMMAAIFMNEAHKRVGAMPGVADVTVSLLRSDIWTPARMKAKDRERLSGLLPTP